MRLGAVLCLHLSYKYSKVTPTRVVLVVVVAMLAVLAMVAVVTGVT
jgi:hypothetical protein